MTIGGFVLTYNPTYWVWPQAERVTDVPDRWSIGSRRNGVEVGARVFLLQQGAGPRGLIALGTTLSTAYQAPHWDDTPGRLAQYVDVQWEDIALSPVLDVHELRLITPSVNWSPRQGGLALTHSQVRDIETAWVLERKAD